MARKFTAEEFRKMAIEAEVIEVYDQFDGHNMNTIAAMLRQAADTYEKIEREIKQLKDLLVPTCSNCLFECAFTHEGEPCKNHTWDGSNVSFVEKITYLKELVNV